MQWQMVSIVKRICHPRERIKGFGEKPHKERCKISVSKRSKENLLTAAELNARFTPEERRDNASKAGKASVEKKRKNREMMDIARRILAMPLGEEQQNAKAIMLNFGLEDSDMNYETAIITKMVTKAMDGDLNAAKFVRDTAGFDPLIVMKEEQLDHMAENGANVNVNLEGKTQNRVLIYLPVRDADPK